MELSPQLLEAPVELRHFPPAAQSFVTKSFSEGSEMYRKRLFGGWVQHPIRHETDPQCLRDL